MSYIIIKIDDFEDFTCGADHHYEFCKNSDIPVSRASDQGWA